MSFAIDVSALVGDIPPASVTLRTFGTATTNTFHESTQTPTDTALSAVVHPTGRRMLERLGLDFQRETISVYSRTSIPIGSEIQYDGRWYKAMAMGDYATLGGLYLVHAQLKQVTA